MLGLHTQGFTAILFLRRICGKNGQFSRIVEVSLRKETVQSTPSLPHSRKICLCLCRDLQQFQSYSVSVTRSIIKLRQYSFKFTVEYRNGSTTLHVCILHSHMAVRTWFVRSPNSIDSYICPFPKIFWAVLKHRPVKFTVTLVKFK